MGLDSVELVLATEQAFGVALPDEELAKVRTPRQLIALVASKLPLNDERACLAQRAFHLVRNLLTSNFAISRTKINLDSDLGKLLPIAQQAQFWRLLAAQPKMVGLPTLARPVWLSLVVWTLGAAAFIYGYRQSHILPALSGLGGLMLVIWLGFLATRVWRREIPGRLRKMRQLINFLIATCPQAFIRDQVGWRREQIAEVVKQVVMEQPGAQQYNEDWDFVKDFGMD